MSPTTSSGGHAARARVGHSHFAVQPDPVRPLWDGDTRGSEVAALASAVLLTVAAAEIYLAGHLGLLFDVVFVVVCFAAACMVRHRDFFTVGVLPPLLMLGTMTIVALNGPKVIASPHDGVVQAVITGLAHHSVALFVGYALCLLTLLARQRLRVR